MLNSAAALVVGGVADGLPSGVERARELISSGKPAEVLERFVEVTRRLSPVKV